MKKMSIIISFILLFILSQCNWYIDYQPYEEVKFKDMPKIVQDSIMAHFKPSENKHSYLICATGNYSCQNYEFASWTILQSVRDNDTGRRFNIYHQNRPFVIYGDYIYFPKEIMNTDFHSETVLKKYRHKLF